MRMPMVALVGRPNVGKSTLFNRIIGQRLAVVDDRPGTTRDRLHATAEWNGVYFTVVDTGGIEVLPERVVRGEKPGPERPLAEDSAAFIPLIRAQAEHAIAEADVVVFLTDASAGLTPADREVADILRRSQKPVFLAANKAESPRVREMAVEFYELGLGEVHPISALHGYGVADLLDKVVQALPTWEAEPEDESVKLAIVGRPNVGKSSLLNQLLGEERAIVSPVPGTTRDAIDTRMEWEGTPITLIDTAGIRRRGRVQPGVERYSVLRALRAIQRSDVTLLMIDATEGVTAQDAHIASFILEERCGVVVLVNKWDLVPKKRQTLQEYTAHVREALKFMDYVPVLFISAKTGEGVDRVIPQALEVHQARHYRIPTGELNRLIRDAVARHAPPPKAGRVLKIYYATQAEVAPPTFVFSVNDPELVHFTYERYLENRIREYYPFTGVPLRLVFRQRKSDRP
ncbi:MAG: ribosome biogenesis GTPase Der [Anaerolineae bacterium]|nr:ribosome biogenesis GTPase Der [Anaerolineae bacterium]MCX8068068.1 ribosome biogenesis GTPase Der [Anaerolineae bacterium]